MRLWYGRKRGKGTGSEIKTRPIHTSMGQKACVQPWNKHEAFRVGLKEINEGPEQPKEGLPVAKGRGQGVKIRGTHGRSRTGRGRLQYTRGIETRHSREDLEG